MSAYQIPLSFLLASVTFIEPRFILMCAFPDSEKQNVLVYEGFAIEEICGKIKDLLARGHIFREQQIDFLFLFLTKQLI